jgi:hypothetical protein
VLKERHAKKATPIPAAINNKLSLIDIELILRPLGIHPRWNVPTHTQLPFNWSADGPGPSLSTMIKRIIDLLGDR